MDGAGRDREAHAYREPVEMGGQPQQPAVGDGQPAALHHPDVAELHRDQPAEQDRLAAQLSGQTTAPAQRRGGHQREQCVEGQLDRERPHLRERRVDGRADIGVGQGQVRQPVGWRGCLYGHGQQRDGHGHPVGGEDAGRAAQVERKQAGTRSAGERGGDERPVEQEAGEQEEDRHAEVHPGQEGREWSVVQRASGLEAHMGGDDRERRQRPQPVQVREGVRPHRLRRLVPHPPPAGLGEPTST